MFRLFSRLTIMKTAKVAKVAFYAVRLGRKPGVYTTWSECDSEVKGFVGARYKKFLTEEEAWNFVNGSVAGASVAADKSSGSSVRDANTKSEEKHGLETMEDAEMTQKNADSAGKTDGNKKRSAIMLPDDFHSSDAKKSKDGPISVYTDGCCINNGKDNPCGGIGVYWGPGHPNNLSERLPGRQTNNRAEILAAMRAIQLAKQEGLSELQIYTDSIFLINCMTKWVGNWKKNGWKSSTGKEVLNREELEQLDTETNGINVTYVHVAGHSGIEGNEFADKLANEGARKKLDGPTEGAEKSSTKSAAEGKKKSVDVAPEAKKSSGSVTSVYTGGSCFNIGKDQHAGLGVYWGPDHPNNLSERLPGQQTNNKAEITAALRAVQQAKQQSLDALQIYTDNIFLFNSMTKWVGNWKKNGWKSSTGKEVQNRDELELLDKETSGINVTYIHVAGDGGDEGKDNVKLAVNLAKEGARKKE